jgi:hypothetical protein
MTAPITFEILWFNEPEDTRPGTPGDLTSIRIEDITEVRRQSLTLACIYASNQLRMRSNTGFVVRRKR